MRTQHELPVYSFFNILISKRCDQRVEVALTVRSGGESRLCVCLVNHMYRAAVVCCHINRQWVLRIQKKKRKEMPGLISESERERKRGRDARNEEVKHKIMLSSKYNVTL